MLLLLTYLLTAMAISFLCSILEATLMSTPLSHITMREEEGYKYAARFKKFKQESSRPIAAILSLNTIANTIGAAGVGRQATIIFGSEWFGLISAIMTILILVFSEIIPKTIGATRWKSLMGVTTIFLGGIIIIMYPLVVIAEFLQRTITPDDPDTSVSREEVSAIANVAEEEEVIDEDENAVIQNLIKMEDIKASDVMTPRVVCAIAPESMKLKTYYKDKTFFHHSRIPVYAESDEYITGYILRSDALQLLADDKFDRDLGSIRRDIELINEDTPLDEIWDTMLSKNEQICCVIDEYGCFQGILTLEDVFETLLGSEIIDENDMVSDMQQYARDRWQQRLKNSRKAPAKKVAKK
jgi:CBS domain containing-hemolysin-like protein